MAEDTSHGGGLLDLSLSLIDGADLQALAAAAAADAAAAAAAAGIASQEEYEEERKQEAAGRKEADAACPSALPQHAGWHTVLLVHTPNIRGSDVASFVRTLSPQLGRFRSV